MKDNARLVLEENQNLLEQISVKDNKTYDLHQAHGRESMETKSSHVMRLWYFWSSVKYRDHMFFHALTFAGLNMKPQGECSNIF